MGTGDACVDITTLPAILHAGLVREENYRAGHTYTRIYLLFDFVLMGLYSKWT